MKYYNFIAKSPGSMQVSGETIRFVSGETLRFPSGTGRIITEGRVPDASKLMLVSEEGEEDQDEDRQSPESKSETVEDSDKEDEAKPKLDPKPEFEEKPEFDSTPEFNSDSEPEAYSSTTPEFETPAVEGEDKLGSNLKADHYPTREDGSKYPDLKVPDSDTKWREVKEYLESIADHPNLTPKFVQEVADAFPDFKSVRTEAAQLIDVLTRSED